VDAISQSKPLALPYMHWYRQKQLKGWWLFY